MITDNLEIIEYKTGSTLYLFSNVLNPENASIVGIDANQIYPSFVLINPLGKIQDLVFYDGKEPWYRNVNNNYVSLSSITSSYYTGYTIYIQTQNYTLESTEAESIFQKFFQGMSILSSGVTTSTPYTNYLLKNYINPDYFVDIKIPRTYSTLDTLNIYNVAQNEFPKFTSKTGTIFGRLVARQKIKDINGKNITIPLANVPVGIFNPTSTYENPNSIDSNGDRLPLNLYQSSFSANTTGSTPLLNQYFNIQSFSSDTLNFLRNAEIYDAVPEEYRYFTFTNENGEFVIHDAPIDSQTLIFEVDLFKQGLTKDEIALNRFPFPGDNSPNVDSIPSLFRREIPVFVVPTWGDGQTGYTEINITAELDLRKWATYFIPPISFEGNTIEKLQVNGFYKPQTIEIRDMGFEGYPTRNIPIVEIQDMLDRVEDQVLEWNNELTQVKGKAEFRTHDYHAFKLPANIYDPFSLNSVGKRGVWLCGYQFKLYYDNKGEVFRATGFERNPIDAGTPITEFPITFAPDSYSRNHFDLNRGEASTVANKFVVGSRFGLYPYEQPWDYKYPEPYSIPRIPFLVNTAKSYSLTTGAATCIQVPKYLDGDLVGAEPFEIPTGGYGLQLYKGNLFQNRFSKRVTKNYVYKYEEGVSWHQEYSNGFVPNKTLDCSGTDIGGISRVVGGEKYQRVEAGYGYFVRPEGWPRIINNTWGDHLYAPDVDANNATFNIDGQDLTLKLDGTIKPSYLKEGSLDLYRIIDPSPQNIIAADPFTVPTYTQYNFQKIYRVRGKAVSYDMRLATEEAYSSGGADYNLLNFSESVRDGSFLDFDLEIYNEGEIDVKYNGGIIPKTGEPVTIPGSVLKTQGYSIKLPGNYNFNFTTFRYDMSKYKFVFKKYAGGASGYGGSPPMGDTYTIGSQVVPAYDITANWYLISAYNNVEVSKKAGSDDCDNNLRNIGGAEINGLVLGVNWTRSSVRYAIWDLPSNTKCGGTALSVLFSINRTAVGWRRV